MSKAIIHYFSGTGNSLLAAKQLSQELVRYGYKVVLHAVESDSHDGMDAYFLHIFFFPIYATAVPHIMRRYIQNLPDGKNVKTAIISTNGKISTGFRDGYQGWALHQARLYLGLKNYQVFFSDTLDYPHNITVALPPRKDKDNEKIIAQASMKYPVIVEKIAKGQQFHRKFFLPNIIWSLPFGFLYSFIGRRIIGKLFAADSSCSLCGRCAKECPVKAIEIYSRVVRWKWNCEGCLHCMNICPRHAIQASGIRYLAILAVVFFNPLFLIGKFIPGGSFQSFGTVGSIIFGTVMNLVLSIVMFVLLDWLIYKISYVPVFKKIAGWGYTRFFGRYSADRFEGKFLNQKGSVFKIF